MLGIINRKLENTIKNVISRLYKQFLRPRLEYCEQMWSPSLQADEKLLKRVQNKALKLIIGYKISIILIGFIKLD